MNLVGQLSKPVSMQKLKDDTIMPEREAYFNLKKISRL